MSNPIWQVWFGIASVASLVSFAFLSVVLQYRWVIADNLPFGKGIVVGLTMFFPIMTAICWGKTIKYGRMQK